MNDFNIIFFVFPFPDGSGDFSFVYKIINSLIKKGIPNHRIHLVVSTRLLGDRTSDYKSFKDMTDALSKCKKPDKLHTFDEKLYKTQLNIETFDPTHSFIMQPTNYIYKSSTDDTKFMITEDLYTTLENTVKSLCKKYDTILKCDTLDPSIRPDINMEQTQKVLIDLIKEQKEKFNRVKIEKILINQRTEQGITDPPTEEDIDDYIKAHFDYTCTIDTNILLMFLKWSVRSEFGVWLTNIIKFFIPLEEMGVSLKLIHNDDLNKVKISDFTTIDLKKDVLLMSFLLKNPVDKETFHESLSTYKHIRLHEGGNCILKGYYSTGFDPENSMCKGVNLLDKSLIDPSYQVPHDGNYHVCYFGNVSIDPKMDPTCILTLFKLKYMINFIKKSRTNAIVCVNKSCYQRVRDYTTPHDIYTIYGTIERHEHFIKLDGIIVYYYDALTNKEFINFVYYSKPLCILRGDQSYFEGISMGKIVLYDMLSFKMPLYKQMLHLYSTFLENLFTKDDVDDFKNITKYISDSIKIININDSYLLFQDALIYNRITGPINYTIYSEGFTYDTTTTGSRIPPINFTYKYLEELYDLTYDLCKFVLDPRLKHKFIEWLYEEYDFDINLFNIIKQEMGFGFKKNKSLKKRTKTPKRSNVSKNLKSVKSFKKRANTPKRSKASKSVKRVKSLKKRAKTPKGSKARKSVKSLKKREKLKKA
jgi:hypothetical protein